MASTSPPAEGPASPPALASPPAVSSPNEPASASASVPTKKRKRKAASDKPPSAGDGSSPAVSSGGRSRAFQRSHARKFGLEVVARDEVTGAVTAALCLFCKHFGREERPGKKRKPTAHFKYFRQSFRTDLYVQHHASQHPALWVQYDALADDDERKRRFFPIKSAADAAGAGGGPTADKLPLLRDKDVAEAAAAARRSPDQRRLWFEINAGIVDLMVGADGGDPHVWTPRGFRACSRGSAPVRPVRTVPTADGTSADGEGPVPVPVPVPDQPAGGRSVYRVGLFTREPLELAVDQFAAGLSPRQAARALAAVAKRVAVGGGSAPSALSAVGEAEFADLARLCVAASLQHLGTLLSSAWGFSLEVRSVRAAASPSGREVPGDVMLELRAVVYVERAADVQDFHLVAFPDAAAHSAAALGAATASLLDAMLPASPSWRGRVVGVAADGLGPEDRGTQLAQWLSDHLRVSSGPHPHPLPVRTWVAAPHLHRALQAFYASLLGGAFLPTWRRLVAHIQAEPALVQEMGRPPSAAWPASARSASASPSAAAVRSPFHARRWLDLGRDAKWVTDKRVRLRKALDERRDRSESPSDAWWVAFFVVNWVAGRAGDALERLRTHPQAAAAAVSDLAAELAAAFRAQAPQALVLSDAADVKLSRTGRYAVAAASTREFVDDLGLFVSNLAARVDAPALDRVLASVAQGVADLVDALVDLSGCGPAPEQQHQAAGDAPLPVDPKDLAALSGRELAARLVPLAALFADDEEARDAVDQEHQALRRAAARDGMGAAASASAPPDASNACASAFARAWAPTGARFPRLQAFAGAVATASAASARLGDLWERGLAVPGRRYGRDADADADADGDAPLRFGRLADTVDLAAETALHAQQFARLAELAAPPIEGEPDAER